MKKMFLTLFLTSIMFGYSGDIKSQSQVSFDKATSILQNQKDLSKATDEVFSFLDNEFNIQLMAMLSLGKDYKSLNEEQKTKYLQAFEKLLKKDFISKISFYKNEKIIVKDVELQNNKGSIIASLNYQGADRKIILSIIKTKNKDEWLIYDINVDDISLISTYRTQFASLYANNDFDTFLNKIAN